MRLIGTAMNWKQMEQHFERIIFRRIRERHQNNILMTDDNWIWGFIWFSTSCWIKVNRSTAFDSFSLESKTELHSLTTQKEGSNEENSRCSDPQYFIVEIKGGSLNFRDIALPLHFTNFIQRHETRNIVWVNELSGSFYCTSA